MLSFNPRYTEEVFLLIVCCFLCFFWWLLFFFNAFASLLALGGFFVGFWLLWLLASLASTAVVLELTKLCCSQWPCPVASLQSCATSGQGCACLVLLGVASPQCCSQLHKLCSHSLFGESVLYGLLFYFPSFLPSFINSFIHSGGYISVGYFLCGKGIWKRKKTMANHQNAITHEKNRNTQTKLKKQTKKNTSKNRSAAGIPSM